MRISGHVCNTRTEIVLGTHSRPYSLDAYPRGVPRCRVLAQPSRAYRSSTQPRTKHMKPQASNAAPSCDTSSAFPAPPNSPAPPGAPHLAQDDVVAVDHHHLARLLSPQL